MPDDVTSLQIRVLSDGVKDAEKRLLELEKAGKRAETQTKATGDSATQMANGFRQGSALATTALASVGVGVLGLSASIASATQQWNEFDKGMRKVRSITQLTNEQFKKMRAEVLEVSQALGVDAKEAAEGLYEIIQADIPKEKAKQFLEVAAKAAQSNGVKIADAVGALKNVINAYGIDAGRAEEISDKLFTTVLYGGASFEELGSYLSGATVTASSFGVSVDEVLAIITAVTAQGTKTAEAVTQVERAIGALINPTEEMKAVLRSLNVETGRQAVEQFGLIGTLERVRQAYAGNDEALVKAMGSVVALQGVLATTGEKADETAKALDHVKNSAGNTAKAVKEGSGSLDQSLNMVKASVIGLVEQIEQSFGILKLFGQSLRDVSALIREVSGMNPGSAVANALALPGEFGAAEKYKQTLELQKQIKAMQERGADASRAGTSVAHDWLSTQGIDDNKLKQALSDLDKLNKSLDALPEHEKNLGMLLYETNEVVAAQREATDPKDVEEYSARLKGLREDYAAVKDEVAATAQAEADKAARQKKIEEDLLKTAQEQAAAKLKQAEAEEAHKKEMEKVAVAATDLAQTEQEKLRAKQEQVRLAMQEGLITDETGTKAVANLEEQIKLIDEREAKKGAGKEDKTGKGMGKSLLDFNTRFEDSLPDLEYNPDETAYEQLMREEEEIRKSYDRRREIILASTELTEDQRQALLAQTGAKYTTAMMELEKERHRQAITNIADFMGNLSQIAGAFGKRGAKAAKALAIMQATVSMYQGAVAAYASAAQNGPYGWILAPVAAGAALASGAAQIANIKSQDDNVGMYEHGGMIPAGKLGVVGEAGAELVRGPAMVTSARTTAGMGKSSNDTQPTINFNVNNTAPGVKVVEGERRTSADGKEIDLSLEIIMEAVANEVSRGGGRLARALETTYPLNRGQR